MVQVSMASDPRRWRLPPGLGLPSSGRKEQQNLTPNLRGYFNSLAEKDLKTKPSRRQQETTPRWQQTCRTGPSMGKQGEQPFIIQHKVMQTEIGSRCVAVSASARRSPRRPQQPLPPQRSLSAPPRPQRSPAGGSTCWRLRGSAAARHGK